MGLFFLSPELQLGEEVVWNKPANRSQGGRAVGGRLYLTARRLIFTPNRIDKLTGGQAWAMPLSDVVSVGTEGTTFRKPLSGGIRRRLRLDLRTGEPQFFVVNQLEEVLERLRSSGLNAPPTG